MTYLAWTTDGGITMARGIFLMTEENRLVEMKESSYDSEDILQDILARFPTLLLNEDEVSDGKRLLLIKREMPVPSDFDESSRWSADHLFISLDGVPIIVEVKRRTDTRIRREVVGQMLDYAANGVVYWPVENLQRCFEENCTRDGNDPHIIMAGFLGDRHDEPTFWGNVKTNLQAGKIRMVFVADDIPRELKRIVEFLNVQMDPAEVIAIEVRQFVDEKGEHKALVPQLIGRTEEATERKSAARGMNVDEAGFMGELSENAKDLYTSILATNGQNGLNVKWGSSGFSIYTSVGDKRIPIVWGYNKASGPKETVQVKFDWMEGVNDSGMLVDKYRKQLLNFDFVSQCGSKREVKIIIGRKLTDQEVIQVVDIIKNLAKEIQEKGLA